MTVAQGFDMAWSHARTALAARLELRAAFWRSEHERLGSVDTLHFAQEAETCADVAANLSSGYTPPEELDMATITRMRKQAKERRRR